MNSRFNTTAVLPVMSAVCGMPIFLRYPGKNTHLGRADFPHTLRLASRVNMALIKHSIIKHTSIFIEQDFV